MRTKNRPTTRSAFSNQACMAAPRRFSRNPLSGQWSGIQSSHARLNGQANASAASAMNGLIKAAQNMSIPGA